MTTERPRLEPGQAQPPREPRSWWEIAALLAFLIWFGSEYVDFRVASRDGQYQIDAEQRTYANRAAICDMQKGLGLNESPSCDDKEIKPYRDPRPPAGTQGGRESVRTRQVVCLMAREMGVTVPTDYCPR